jgi:hypothetical protein
MISEMRAHFNSIAKGKWAEVTTSKCGEAAVLVTAERNETGNNPPPQIDVSSLLVHS